MQDGSQSPSPREAANQRLREMVERASSRMTLVSFALAEQGGDLQVNVVNRESGEVVRRIPPDEILHLRQVLEDLRGLLISEVT